MTLNHRCFFLFAVGVVALVLPVSSVTGAGISSVVSLENLQPDDEQFFSLGQLDAGLVAFGVVSPVAGLPNDFEAPDTIVATFLEDGGGPGVPALLTINDDSSTDDNLTDATLGSVFRFEAPESGDYTVGVTGFDNFFEGAGHDESGDYLLATGVVDPSSLGGDFADTDGANDTLAGADLLTLGDFESRVAVNTLADVAGGDVDFYEVELRAGDVFTAMTAPLGDDFFSPDTVLFLFDENGGFLIDDDEAGGDQSDFTPANGADDGLGSALNFFAPQDGTYFLAVAGFAFGADDEILPHTEVGDYALLVSRASIIPEPGSLTLLALAGLGLLGRRRPDGAVGG